MSRAGRQIQARTAQVLRDQKLVLFGVSTDASNAVVVEYDDRLREQLSAAGSSHGVAQLGSGLEGGLRAQGRALHFVDTFSPSSGTVCRARLYHLRDDILEAAS